MATRLFPLALVLTGLTGATGCRAPEPPGPLPGGDSTLTFFGEGRSRLDFGAVASVPFATGSSDLPGEDVAGVTQAGQVLANGGRVMLVGVGDDRVSLEHGRQQALARALAVRRALVRSGGDAGRILITGIASTEAAGVSGGTASGPRVECAVVRW